ncbi:response regulator [Chelatococcus sp. GCM10030263]|uniref:response regulator n=1 Tax=Chelatococcus sp. GCM10030263 TaxID=3273387 RepID=UPI00361E3F45
MANADPGASPADGRKLKILLVEDEVLVRLTTNDMLLDFGHEVEEAHDGRSALAIVEAGQPIDLLITDIGLPDMSGAALAAECRKRLPDLRIIFASGYGADRIKDVASDTAHILLAKPFLIGDLKRALDQALGHRSAEGPEQPISRG